MQPAWWRTPRVTRGTLLCLALLLGVLAQATAWAQKPAPADSRELIAVLELDGVGATPGQLAAASEELRAQLLHSGRFRVVDRQQVDALLKEQAFQQTGCTSQECAVQVGKMLGVRKIVTGRITKIDEALWQAAAQMVDVESGETLRAETVNQRGAFDALLGEGLAALTGKLTGGVPAIASSATAAAEVPKGGGNWRDPVTGAEFVYVPSGSFEMMVGCGRTWILNCEANERAAKQIAVGGFWLGKTEVTQGQWTRIMGNNPSIFKKGDTYPVESVSWTDAEEFVSRLNSQSGGVKFRLPTEAEWEYACRGGGEAQVYGTQSGELSTGAAKYRDSGKDSTRPVASYPPNALGLYDMTGNIWEWVQDAYAGRAREATINPVNNNGAYRAARGAGWGSDTRLARCSDRLFNVPGFRNDFLGLRLLRIP